MRRALACAALGMAAGAAAVPALPAQSRGERLYRQCFACHALEPGRDTPAGPSLHAVVGGPIAARAGFDYSPALRRFAARHRTWTPALLDRFLADPEALVRGTEMGFVGLADPGDRAALAQWLAAQDD